jgi:hypothetical protein
MKSKAGKLMVLVTLFAAIQSIQASASVSSKAIEVDFPSDLPELAQGRANAMYLHRTADRQVMLYLEKAQGQKLAILDVTDPAHIKAVGEVSIAAPSTYDFVQSLGGSVALIRYRNHSGFAVISFKHYKQPVLTAEPDYLHPAKAEPDGSQGELLISAKSSSTSAPEVEPQYEVLRISGSGATPVATIENVIQRVDRAGTGTVFLLNDKGVTVVRRLSLEREHQIEIWQEEQP